MCFFRPIKWNLINFHGRTWHYLRAHVLRHSARKNTHVGAAVWQGHQQKCVTQQATFRNIRTDLREIKKQKWICHLSSQQHWAASNGVNSWLNCTRAPLAVCCAVWGIWVRHSQGHAVIVRMFFLLESRRGNGTKLFTSLKHKPVGPRGRKELDLAVWIMSTTLTLKRRTWRHVQDLLHASVTLFRTFKKPHCNKWEKSSWKC